YELSSWMPFMGSERMSFPVGCPLWAPRCAYDARSVKEDGTYVGNKLPSFPDDGWTKLYDDGWTKIYN
nr:hypothetical protein [Tanacetum cinerariifolium]